MEQPEEAPEVEGSVHGQDDMPRIDLLAADPPPLGGHDGHDRLSECVIERWAVEQTMSDELAQQ